MKNLQSTFALLVLGAGAALIAGLSPAQEFRSTLSGHVTDPSGAAVPGAAVRAVNTASQQTYSATTTGSGDYLIPYVLPGTYKVSAAASGFKEQVNQGVVLEAGEASVLNFHLEIGTSNQSVEVTGTAPLLDAENAVQNYVLSGRELENVPLNGRQIYTLVGTTPGSQFLQTQFGASGYSGTRGWDVSNNYTLGGGVQGYQQFTLNGSNITEQNNGTGTWEIAPNVDALQEVSIQTTEYDARYGRSSGGFVNMVVKSGSNQFHGDLYDYLENGDLNANNFENNLNGIPTQKTQQNQFGGTFGGPVIKDKVFFFGSFEGYVENIPFTTLTSVPPAYLRPSGSSGVNFTPSGYTIYQPNSTYCSTGGPVSNCSGTLLRQPFPNDTIPASQISPVGAALINLYPAANTNVNGLTNNYIADVPDRYRYWQPIARVDYDTSDKTRWYSLFAFQHGTEFRNVSGFPPPAENGNINTMRQELLASEDMTHIFSPTLVMDVRASFSRFQDHFPDGDLVNQPNPSSIGLNMPNIPTSTLKLLPEITFNQTYPQIVGNQVTNDVYNNYILDVDLTKTVGKHTIHFGGEAGLYDWGQPNTVGHPNGDFEFGTNTLFTQDNPYSRGIVPGINDGNVLADLLLGDPDSGGVDWNQSTWTHFPAVAFYGQDDWHVINRLTLNIGLRYDIQFGLRGNGLNRGMCLTCLNPVSNDPTYQANLTADSAALAAAGINVSSLRAVYGGVLFAGANGQPQDAYNTDYSNLGPRFGFAYQLTPKTVLRGGYGIMYAVGLEGGSNVGFNQTTPYVATTNGGITPTNLFASGNPFPAGAEAPLGAAGGLLTAVGNQATFDFPGRRIPRSQQVSLGIQRELGSSMLLDVRYAGNFTDRLRTTAYSGAVGAVWINAAWSKQMDNAAIANPNVYNQPVPNPFYGVPSIPTSSTLGSSPTLPEYYLTLPFPEFPGALGDYDDPLGKNWYNSMEAQLTKRLSHGVSLRAAYTYSKTMQAAGYENGWPYQDPNLLYQISPTDRTHVFTLSGVYNLPSIKSDSTGMRVLGAVVNHWVVSNVLTAETGFPLQLPGGYYYESNHSWTPTGGPTMSQWLYNCNGNPLNCWVPLQNNFALNNLPQYISTIRQPQVPNLDVSVERNFPITEQMHIQFRADAFNITNSVLFNGGAGSNGFDNNPFDGPPVKTPQGYYTGFGTIAPFQNNFPRILQFSLKFYF
ncbi:MAG: carboxypeptidase regulatory-like domain-containing protein [Acidobacteriaceae bacterium]|nr:carboxypeptidase regulatory-like domain-containing protein [Acidobacteriaceae bacterium]